MNTIKTLALATIIIVWHHAPAPKNLKCYECVDNNKKKVEVVVMSHFQDKAMPAY